MSDTGTPRPPWGLGKSLTLAAVVVFGLVVVLMLTVDTTPPAIATEAVTEAESEPVTEAESEPVTEVEPEPVTEVEPEPVTEAAAAPVAEQVAATEGEACRSVTDAGWIENPDALRFHRKGSAIHVEATEPGGLLSLCRYATDGGALLKVQLLEINPAATPSDRFMEAAAYVIGLFAVDAVAWFENAVETRAKWPAGMVHHETAMQTISVGNIAGSWEMSIARAADYALQN